MNCKLLYRPLLFISCLKDLKSMNIVSWPFYRRLFELLVLSGALAELTWPEILKRRQLFRYRFCNIEKEYKYSALFS